MNRIWKVVPCLILALALSGSAHAQDIFPPTGRLTLQSNTPVMTSDVVGATTIYWTQYNGSQAPIYQPSTSVWATYYNVPQLSVSLAPSVETQGNVYDVYMFKGTSGVQLGIGPAWATTTSRGTGAGTTQLANVSGLWLNAVAINLYNGTGYTFVQINSATYLGSVYMTANGETSAVFNPLGVAGGSNNVIGIWNAYNRVRCVATETDSNTSWSDTGTTWRTADSAAGTGNRITYLDGLQEMTVTGRFQTVWAAGANGANGLIGVALDATTGATFPISGQTVTTSGGNQTLNVAASYPPKLGLHYIQAMETPGGSEPYATYYGSSLFALTLETEY